MSNKVFLYHLENLIQKYRRELATARSCQEDVKSITNKKDPKVESDILAIAAKISVLEELMSICQ